jgi:tetratricopeptide (TPR) repeat protein
MKAVPAPRRSFRNRRFVEVLCGALIALGPFLQGAPAGAQSRGAAPYAMAHHAVSTSDPGAQAAFDEGLTLLYAFNPEEARDAFERAAKADPRLAMAWWGVAMSYGGNINLGYSLGEAPAGLAAANKALGLQAGASPLERSLIEAVVKRFDQSGKDAASRAVRDYRDAMNAAADAYPADDDVQVLAAESGMDVQLWDYWTDDGRPKPGTQAILERLERVLERNPGHLGAMHFLIHTVEQSPHPEDALPAARGLASLRFEPAAEHLTHMPSHIFMRVGLYHDAGAVNQLAESDYHDYLHGRHAGHEDYFLHDCLFGVDAFGMSGELERAKALAAACRTDDPYPLAAIVGMRFGRWDELATADAPSDLARGLLLVARGQLADAAKTHDQMRAKTGGAARVDNELLQGRIEEACGDSEAALAALRDAVALQDADGYSEPPSFWYPVRETLGGAYFRAGRYAEAERTFRDDLARNPDNPRSLFGLARTLEREGRGAEAGAAQARFARAWQNADVMLDMESL